MNKILKICMVIAATLSISSCYNEFEEPAPAKVWTKEDFAQSKYISIKDFKQLFYAAHGNSAASLGKSLEITEDYVISGRVISSDQAGNVYKSVYIYDDASESAIELKLMVSNYVSFPIGQTVFVKAKGLAIGNYRYMLSVGGAPTKSDIDKGYANRNIEQSVFLNRHIFKGKIVKPTAADTLVITPENYKEKLNDDALGRLVRFEGLTYKEGTFDKERYPQYLETTYPNGSTTAQYTNKYYAEEGLDATYAYSKDGNHYYGSSLFGYEGTSMASGNYIVRVSGYANFALQLLPANRAKGDITAIYTKYSSKSGGFVKYQLLINSFDDIRFPTGKKD